MELYIASSTPYDWVPTHDCLSSGNWILPRVWTRSCQHLHLGKQENQKQQGQMLHNLAQWVARCRAQCRRLAQAEHLTWRRPVTTHPSNPWRTLCKNAAMIGLPCRHIISRWPNSGKCTGLLCPSAFLSWLWNWIPSKPIWIKMHIDCHAVCSFFTAMLEIVTSSMSIPATCCYKYNAMVMFKSFYALAQDSCRTAHFVHQMPASQVWCQTQAVAT